MTEKGERRKGRGGAGRVTTRREHWRGLVEAWAGSGLTQAEFCRRRGLTPQQFCWWKQHLVGLGLWPRGEGVGGRPARPKGRRPAEDGAAAFVAVGEAPAALLTGLGGASEEAMTLVLPGGWRIALGQRFEAEALGRLLAVLETRPC